MYWSLILSDTFKIQAVEKALERANDVSVKNMADDFGVGHSTLSKWIESRLGSGLSMPYFIF